LPEGYNAFNWSVPFIGDRIMDMFNNILNQSMRTKHAKSRKKGQEPEEDKVPEGGEESKAQISSVFKEFAELQAKEEAEKKGSMLRKKVQAMGRIGKIYNTLKEEHVLLLKMKQMAPDGRLPKGLLLEGRPAIKNAYKAFKLAKDLDQTNERRPKVSAPKKK